MSALGQKQTCAARKVMSALPSKADMCGAKRDVGFVPLADMTVIQFRRRRGRAAVESKRARFCGALIGQQHAAGTDHHPQDREGVQPFSEQDKSEYRGHGRN